MPWKKRFDQNDVLDRMMAVFWAQGYHGTAIQDLVNAAGINRASLYDTFGDKRATFTACLRRYDQSVRARHLRELRDQLSPRESIKALLRGTAARLTDDHRARGCFMTNTATELAGRDVDMAAIVGDSQREVERFFHHMILAAQAEGTIDPALDAETTAAHLLAGLLGMLVLVKSRPERHLLETIAESTIALLGPEPTLDAGQPQGEPQTAAHTQL
ncbi:TetR/AcrR family transcriptional regulator [Yunchengibacter salinarum]|uniref:TetR/AcrR family transcriptional regulator n=1 Tax=Yunchengibacter salinarum TaxID=3133399 RepID=UPI0035B67E32